MILRILCAIITVFLLYTIYHKNVRYHFFRLLKMLAVLFLIRPIQITLVLVSQLMAAIFNTLNKVATPLGGKNFILHVDILEKIEKRKNNNGH